MRGKMIWFNAVKGSGFIRTVEDERLYVGADAFRAGEAPEGRCGGQEVTFERLASEGDAQAVNVQFLSETEARRARPRHHRAGRSL